MKTFADMNLLEILNSTPKEWAFALAGRSPGEWIKEAAIEAFGNVRVRGGQQEAAIVMSDMLADQFFDDPSEENGKPLMISLRDQISDPRVKAFVRQLKPAFAVRYGS